ncbi:MAG: hypothetical protein P1V18_06100 [Candidatus Gracilibacteria bacterium]|nr:hypothetical protein [Candidatus Gracilibacteria bacterium]
MAKRTLNTVSQKLKKREEDFPQKAKSNKWVNRKSPMILLKNLEYNIKNLEDEISCVEKSKSKKAKEILRELKIIARLRKEVEELLRENNKNI